MVNLTQVSGLANVTGRLPAEKSGDGLYDGKQLHLYRQALAQSGDAVVIANVEGVIEYVNGAFETITGYTAAEAIGGRPALLKSGQHDAAFYAQLWSCVLHGRSFRATFVNRTKSGALYHEEKTISPIMDLTGRITHYVSNGRNVDARIASERMLHRLAYYDTLTSLPNRKLFLQRLADSLAPDCGTGLVLLLDINNLKRINDTLGHGAGDQALRTIASRLESFCRGACRVARSGGDEFALIVMDACPPPVEPQAVVESVLALLSQPLCLGKQEVFLSASVGIARFPLDAHDPEDLLRHADLALHRAKEAGRNVFMFYQESMRESLTEDLRIESALYGALEREELSLAFQPIVRSTDGAMVGVEALLRWDSPLLGSVSPARFIPQMEKNGLIVPVGRWVLETACRAVADLGCRCAPPIRLAVNVSARQLLHPDFVGTVKAAFESTGFAAERLELEITESVLIENTTAAVAVLQSLHQLGVRIAADDFGTGYSSLSYLWKFPFNTLKIDRSFVAEMERDPQVLVIVEAILNLARGLGVDVVAEGVESESQFGRLKELGQPYIQGYWTGRPSPITAIQVRCQARADKEKNEE